MKTTKYIITAILLSALLIAGCGESITGRIIQPTQEETTIKIGAIQPLTGSFAFYGKEYQKGLEMAAEEINADGGILGKQIKLVFEDSEGETSKAVTAAQKLINVDRVNYLFVGFAGPSRAVAPIAQQDNVIVMGQTTTRIGDEGEYIFKDHMDERGWGLAMGKVINQENLNRIGVVAVNYEGTEFFLEGLKESAKNNVILFEELFNFGDTDFRTQLTKFKDRDVDAILIYSFAGSELDQITKQIQEMSLDDRRLLGGASAFGLPDVYQPHSRMLEKMGAVEVWYPLDEDNPLAANFIEKYNEKFGEMIVGDVAYTYDGLYALKTAIERAGTTEDTEKIAEELRSVEMVGAAGPLSFDEEGNSIREAYLQIFTEEGWQKYELE